VVDVFKLKEDYYTKDNSYISSGTLFFILNEGVGDNNYVSFENNETKSIWALPELFEFHSKKEVPQDEFLEKILFLIEN